MNQTACHSSLQKFPTILLVLSDLVNQFLRFYSQVKLVQNKASKDEDSQIHLFFQKKKCQDALKPQNTIEDPPQNALKASDFDLLAYGIEAAQVLIIIDPIEGQELKEQQVVKQENQARCQPSQINGQEDQQGKPKEAKGQSPKITRPKEGSKIEIVPCLLRPLSHQAEPAIQIGPPFDAAGDALNLGKEGEKLQNRLLALPFSING